MTSPDSPLIPDDPDWHAAVFQTLFEALGPQEVVRMLRDHHEGVEDEIREVLDDLARRLEHGEAA